MTEAAEEDTLHFAELSGVRPMIETFPLERAAEAYARMMSGKGRFRIVLTMWARDIFSTLSALGSVIWSTLAPLQSNRPKYQGGQKS
jgi:hypothetical protein